MGRDPAERFWSKVEMGGDAGCWIWTARTDRHGYGAFSFKSRPVLAHRWAYEQRFGPIPTGLQIDHLCRVRDCVNPAHLEAVTPRENTRRGDAGRHHWSKDACKYGHEFSPENTYLRPNGGRQCRACMRRRHRQWVARNAA